MDTLLNVQHIPRDPQSASKYLVDVLLNKIYPLILRIRNQLQADIETDADVSNVQSVFTLCCSQIKKCVLNLFEIFKLENEQAVLLQDTRQFTLERLSWCVNRLVLVEEKLDLIAQNPDNNDSCDDSLFATPMYFVNWMDHTFEVLSKLAGIIYKTDYKENEELHFEWKMELLECVRVLHTSLDELLLAAMTLCKYCLPADQIMVKTRCQVVLREAKVLLNELIEEDTDGKFTATVNSLKLPIMPTNVNVTIDVLKDVLYVLETNTNTALLALVVHCFSNTVCPVDRLRDHFSQPGCPHHDGSGEVEDCEFVMDFDLYSERLLQIGSFAVSCSSDQERIAAVRSGLASLEALEPALVPALRVAARGAHARLLAAGWRAALRDIREAIFLIVDPAAFAEKTKQMMHLHLSELFGLGAYSGAGVRAALAAAGGLRALLAAYARREPRALPARAPLDPALDDLDKALLECKVVSNLLCGKDDFVYDVKKPTHNKEVSFEQLAKRLKLLYTLVNRINRLLHPEDSQDQFFKSDLEDPSTVPNATYTMNGNTYISSPKKITNATRGIFAKTTIRTPAKKLPLNKLAQQIKAKKCNELNFSVQLDQMFNLSELEKPEKNRAGLSISTHRNSILYNVSPRKNRTSLRKMVLNKCCNLSEKQFEGKMSSETLVKETLIDDTTSLQISEILDQMHDMTKLLSKPRCNSTRISKNEVHTRKNTSISKYLRGIPADASTWEARLDESEANATVPSDVSTLERLKDLNRIDTKLCNLKLMHKETRL